MVVFSLHFIRMMTYEKQRKTFSKIPGSKKETKKVITHSPGKIYLQLEQLCCPQYYIILLTICPGEMALAQGGDCWSAREKRLFNPIGISWSTRRYYFHIF